MAESIDRHRLGIYLNDHLTSATAGLRLARRTATEHRGSEYGTALERMVGELEEEREFLLQVMHKLDVPENPLKKLAGWALERAGRSRTKGNGEQLAYSPLSRLLELEDLLIGATGSRCLWQTLELVRAHAPALSQFDFAALQERAGRRVSSLAQLRLEARLPAIVEPTPQEVAPAARTRETAPIAAKPETAAYAGPERRSGGERRRRQAPPPTTDRRAGTDRRAVQTGAAPQL